MTVLDQSPAEARAERLSAAPPSVEIERVFKTFRLPKQRYSTLKERALHPFRSMQFDELKAVQNTSVTVKQGEFFGIVGRNGSGKSSLLKCIAGIYRPESGRIAIHGRLAPFIELGVGFNQDLAAFDNVLINAVMMGLSRKQAAERFEKIIAFAELEEFTDLKLKNYSSGMAVRLAFATAIQVDADVLLIDEVLAVGDANFQQKCFEEFTRLKNDGRTIVFVTHDMSAVERYCDRAMLIERGVVQHIGEPRDIARAYNELNFGRMVHTLEDKRHGDHTDAEIVDAWFEHEGERVGEVAQYERVSMVVRVRFHNRVSEPVLGLTLRNDVGHTVFATATDWKKADTGVMEAGEELTARVEVDVVLAPTRYELSPSLAHAGGGDVIDIREDLASCYVHGTRVTGGLVDLPHDFELERHRS